MYIYTQIVGFIFTLLIFIIWILNKKLDSFTDSIFVFISLVAMVSQILDIMCQLAMSQRYFELAEIWQIVIIDAYLISIPAYVFFISLYINKLLFRQDKFKKIEIILFIIYVISCVVTCLLPKKPVYNARCSLADGVGVTYTYFASFVFSAALLIELLVHRKDLKKWTFSSTAIWLSSFMIGGIIQFILINKLYIPIISLAIAVGVLLLYLIVENPGNRFDYISNCFHFESFVEYINEVIEAKEIQALLYISILEKSNNSYYLKSILDELIRVFEKNKNVKVFSGYSDELIVTSKDFGELQEMAASISKCIDEYEDSKNNRASFLSSILLVPEMSYVSSYEVMRGLFDEYNVKKKDILEDFQVDTVKKEVCEKIESDLRLAAEVDNAIKERNIVVEYQPLSNKDNSDKVDAEAIAKLITSSGRILLPADYYGVAEKFDRFMLIDEITFATVCETISYIEKFKNKLGIILCRVSVQALEKITVCESFFEVLERNNIAPTRICLEITNAKAILQKDMFLSNVTAMQRRGIKFAIGGFGSGESNLNYFIDLPMHFIKFDQSVLNNALKDQKAARIMKDITDLAHSLDFKVVAVGVKDEDSKKFAEECGVEMLLGELISLPFTKDEFIKNVIEEGGAAC